MWENRVDPPVCSSERRALGDGQRDHAPGQDVSGAGSNVVRPLSEDGALSLVYDSALAHLVECWLPRHPAGRSTGSDAAIEVVSGSLPALSMEDPPTLRLGNIDAWYVAPDERVEMAGRADGGGRGLIELRPRRALLCVDAEARGAVAAADIYSMLTVAAALLLGRLGRALVHAGAVVAPAGYAWAVAGDAKSGKSTLCADLIAAGWAYLSDDQIVLWADRGLERLRTEGWPRDFHLDEGWGRGVPTGTRRDVDPRSLGPGRWQRTATLAGTLLPEVVGEAPTRVSSVEPSETLTALVRQAPWLMADPAAAPACLELLRAAARLPAYRVSLGRDAFGDAAVLLAALRAAGGPS